MATFCIFKTIYKIGEDVVGTFSFSEGDTPCLQVRGGGLPRGCADGAGGGTFADSLCPCQYLVSLQTEERVQDAFQRRRGQAASYSTHARHQESCLHTARTSFSLPIPLSSAPGFSTNIGEPAELELLKQPWSPGVALPEGSWGNGGGAALTTSYGLGGMSRPACLPLP